MRSVSQSPPTYELRSSIVLIRSNNSNILFESGGQDDRLTIINLLRDRAGLYPEDIDVVVNSHGHPDHTANNNLFSEAQLFSYNGVNIRGHRFTMRSESDQSEHYLLNDRNIQVLQSPGHTSQDTSLIIRNSRGRNGNSVALVGSLFLNSNDKDSSRDLASDSSRLTQSRSNILCQVDSIIPGHGAEFRVTEQMRQDNQCASQNNNIWFW
jgi:glyoxylase-like metal-dependent hydrolase (beta-lactamase superfamily II)